MQVQFTKMNGAGNDFVMIDNTAGTFMPVHVDKVADTPAGTIFAIAHRYEQNGDLMSDPDMTFIVGNGTGVFPITFQQDSIGLYQDAVQWGDGGEITGYRRRLQRDLTTFANQWMRNIGEQQRL